VTGNYYFSKAVTQAGREAGWRLSSRSGDCCGGCGGYLTHMALWRCSSVVMLLKKGPAPKSRDARNLPMVAARGGAVNTGLLIGRSVVPYL